MAARAGFKAVQAQRTLTGIAGVAFGGVDRPGRTDAGAQGTAFASLAYFPAEKRDLAQDTEEASQRAEVAAPEALREQFKGDHPEKKCGEENRAAVEDRFADSLEPVLLQLVEQGDPTDAEVAGGFRTIAARLAERPGDEATFERVDAFLEAEGRVGPMARAALERDFVHHPAGRQSHHAFDGVLELAHVALVGAVHQRLPDFAPES